MKLILVKTMYQIQHDKLRPCIEGGVQTCSAYHSEISNGQAVAAAEFLFVFACIIANLGCLRFDAIISCVFYMRDNIH